MLMNPSCRYFSFFCWPQVRAWDLRQDAALARIYAADRADARTHLRLSRCVFLCLAQWHRALRKGHEALSVFVADPDERLPLAHRVMVLVTALLGMLCVQIWFFYTVRCFCMLGVGAHECLCLSEE